MNTNQSQRGSILIYAMLTMSAMLAIGLTLNSMFLGKLKTSAAARDSVVALYAADSAVELCLFEARQAAPVAGAWATMANGATFDVKVLVAGQPDNSVTDCSGLGDSFNFRATGAFRGVRRSLEISQ
jgi:Tfp pilus assembly protein PilX